MRDIIDGVQLADSKPDFASHPAAHPPDGRDSNGLVWAVKAISIRQA